MGCELGNLTSWAPLSCYIVSLQWPQLTPHQTSLNTASEKYGKRYLLWFFSFLVSLTNISSQLHTCGKEGTETLNVILSADLLWLCFDVHNPCNNHIYELSRECIFTVVTNFWISPPTWRRLDVANPRNPCIANPRHTHYLATFQTWSPFSAVSPRCGTHRTVPESSTCNPK